MAERVGFEPTVEFPLHSLSRRALSTAQTPLRAEATGFKLNKGLERSQLRSKSCLGREQSALGDEALSVGARRC